MRADSSSERRDGDGEHGPLKGTREVHWSAPKPERIPQPTAMPAATALGVTLIAFGALTSTIVSIAGALLTAFAVARWIKEMHDAAEG